jgi:endo-1,4-beta-xylanase
MKISARWSLAFLFIASLAMAADAPPVILLWPNGAPGSEGKTADEVVKVTANGERIITGVNKPSVTVFLPKNEIATGVGVLIAPGGGHYQLSYDSEGCYVGQWLAERGIAGFVLTNRLAREKGSTYTIEGDELPDTQRAMRLIRSHAAEWNVDPDRLGMIGFSAGGELVNLLVEKNDDGNPQAADPIDRFGCKPAFQGLLYPGNSKSIAPTKDSPPAFLVCGAKDRPDISEGLPNVYLLFKKAGVPVELHIYANTGHGFGYRPRSTAAANQWPFRFQEWLMATGFLKKPEVPATQPTTERAGP